MHRKTHVGFGEEGTCFLPEANQERRCALTLPKLGKEEFRDGAATVANSSGYQIGSEKSELGR